MSDSEGENKNLVVRDEKGRFVKGSSGNPAGKIKGQKNWLTLERISFEKALREYISDDARAQKLLRGIDRVLAIATNPEAKDQDSLTAMKIMLDRVMPAMPPKMEEEAQKTDRKLQIIIQTNPDATKPVEAVIEGEYDEIED